MTESSIRFSPFIFRHTARTEFLIAGHQSARFVLSQWLILPRSQKFPPVDVPRGIETNKAVTEVGAVYDIAPSRTPLLVSMTNRCLLVGSARRRHSTLRLFHEKPGRHLSFSRVCAPSNLSDNVFTKKVCRLSEKNILARFVYVTCRTNIVKIIFSVACFNNIFISKCIIITHHVMLRESYLKNAIP